MNQITQFLLERGTGFYYAGSQVHLKVGEREFYIDMLFYPIIWYLDRFQDEEVQSEASSLSIFCDKKYKT